MTDTEPEEQGEPKGTRPQTAAQGLEGLTLPGGWQVVQSIVRPEFATGGHASHTYAVQRDGQRAFMKAFDYSAALQAPNTAETLQALTQAFLFERDLLQECSNAHMSRVVLALDSGEVDVPGFDVLGRVNYLVFELAERDARQHRVLSEQLDVAWALRALHHVATGLQQLHGRGITHQDLKPSNILVFASGDSKIGDLGRANRTGVIAPHDTFPIPGDHTYAPPELLYGEYEADPSLRRRSSDVYHLGSVLLFLFTGVATTPALLAKLPQDMHPRTWSGTYREVLPLVRDAFARVISDLATQAPPEFADNLVSEFVRLCDPDPKLRGDPHNRVGTSGRYLLVRFVSRFNLLAREAELKLRGSG